MAESSRHRLTREEWDAVLRSKGWSKKEVAQRWGVSPVWVSNISRSADRAPHWDDAVLGLPHRNFLGRNEKRRKSMVQALVSASRPGDASVKRGVGYRYRVDLRVGAIVVAAEDVGSIAEEGMRGIVFGTRDRHTHEEYGVIFETGVTEWFAPEHIDRYIAATGLYDERSSLVNFPTDGTAQHHYRSGQFMFYV